MSLEASITKLAASIDALTAKINVAQFLHETQPSTPVVVAPAADKPQPVKTEASDKPKPVEYDADRVSAKAALNRPALIELLGRYGAKKGSQVKAEYLPAFYAELDKIEAA